jgi:D-alanyl-D-alanine dipeptidase
LFPTIYIANNTGHIYYRIITGFRAVLIVVLALYCSNYAQNKGNNPYNLSIISSPQSYKELVNSDSENILVDIKKYIPSLKLDIRYAGKNNFLGEPVYNYARAFLRKPAAGALLRVQKELNKAGLGLKIFDAYRPYSATLKFYDKVKDTQYVAAPWSGSRHNRGCAVDLTIISLKTSKELEMPTGFDSFRVEAHSDYLNISADKIKNRDLLIGVMAKYGFVNLPTEWWHYDYKDWNKFDIMDLSFEQLDEIK